MTFFTDPEQAGSKAWCSQLFNNLAEGGTWAVPRSGLIFSKRGGKLVCSTRMPHMAEMPLSAAELTRQQDADVAVIRRHFAAVDIPVEDQSK